jgi:hypothetical protein
MRAAAGSSRAAFTSARPFAGGSSLHDCSSLAKVVITGLDPVIHVLLLLLGIKDVDGRVT